VCYGPTKEPGDLRSPLRGGRKGDPMRCCIRATMSDFPTFLKGPCFTIKTQIPFFTNAFATCFELCFLSWFWWLSVKRYGRRAGVWCRDRGSLLRARMLGKCVWGENPRAVARQTGLLFVIQMAWFRSDSVPRANGVWRMMGRHIVKRRSLGIKHI
jgi:hypothetical protein